MTLLAKTGTGKRFRPTVWFWLTPRLLNTAVYGHLFDQASDDEVESLRIMGRRWKEYERQGKWKYEGE